MTRPSLHPRPERPAPRGLPAYAIASPRRSTRGSLPGLPWRSRSPLYFARWHRQLHRAPCRSRPSRRRRPRRRRPGRPPAAPRPARRHVRDRRDRRPVAQPRRRPRRALPRRRRRPLHGLDGSCSTHRHRRPADPDVRARTGGASWPASTGARRPVREATRLHPRRGRRDRGPPRAEARSRLQVGYMKVFDPAVVEARSVAADVGRVGPLRAIEVTRPPSDERAQLAYAHLLPPPTDIPPATIDRAARRRRTAPSAAIGPAAGDPRPAVRGILLGSIVHELSADPGVRRRPRRDRRRRRLAGRRLAAVGRRSTAGSRAAPGSRSAGTSCPTTRPTARTSASSRAVVDRARRSRRRIASTPRPTCASRPAGDGRRDTRFRSDRRGVRGGAPRLPRLVVDGTAAEGGRRRRPGRHRHLPADRRPAAPASDRRRRGRSRPTAPARPSTTAIVHLVPHTHWDREWYEPFQMFRMRLVELVDQLLDPMEARRAARASPSTARPRPSTTTSRSGPSAEPLIERLIAEGRLAIGPWQILHGRVPRLGRDDHPEPRVRLARGRGARRGRCRSATCRTCSATSPRCRRSCAGPGSATRSSGAASRRRSTATRSRWRRPTARGRAEYLVGGYGNGAYLFDVPDRLGRKLAALRRRQAGVLRRPLDPRDVRHGPRGPLPAPRRSSPTRSTRRDDDRRPDRDPEPTSARRAPDRSTTGPRPPAGPASSARRPGEHADERHLGPDRHQGRRRPGGAAPRALRRAAGRAPRRRLARAPARARLAAGRRQLGPRLDLRLLAGRVVTQVLTRFAEAEQIGRGILDARAGAIAAGVAARQLRPSSTRRRRPDGRGRADRVGRRPAASSRSRWAGRPCATQQICSAETRSSPACG